tara:strand:+ start:313 stop:591 length:279 start_codon:yes stop_codon:yes gene_type:complete
VVELAIKVPHQHLWHLEGLAVVERPLEVVLMKQVELEIHLQLVPLKEIMEELVYLLLLEARLQVIEAVAAVELVLLVVMELFQELEEMVVMV